MWQEQYEITTDLSADRLFSALSDINSWNKWDDELDYTEAEREIKEGDCFILKPKGGPRFKIWIEELKSPCRHVDLCHLFLAKMRTTHEYLPSGNETLIRTTFQIWGPLGFFWSKLIGEKQIRGAPEQTASFVNYVREHSISE